MLQYSISDLEKITGIKAHTIRMWEKRYDLIQPQRTESNIRFYSQEDMQRLQDIVILYDQGIKISQIAAMETTERIRLIREFGNSNTSLELRKDCFTAAVLEFNEEKFITLFDNYEKRYGLLKTLTTYIWPYIEDSSLLYMSGAFNQAHENFINQVIKRKIMARMDQIQLSGCVQKGRVLIFLPPGEYKEIYAAGMEYACRLKGYHTLNIGVNIGFDELQSIDESLQIKYVLTMLDTDFKNMAVQPFLKQVKSIFPKADLIVCGHLASSQSSIDIKGVTILDKPADVLDYFS